MPNSSDWDKQQKALGASFLQSTYWESFQSAIGIKTHRLNEKTWTCLLLEQHSKMGKYLFAPYGPTLEDEADLADAINAICAYAKKQNANWLRIEPSISLTTSSNIADLDTYGFKQHIIGAPKQVNPEFTSIIDIRPDEKLLLANLSQSTRSVVRKNINQTELGFETSTNPVDMEIFVAMMTAVSERNSVHFHTKDYFIKQSKTLMPLGVMRLELALKGKKPIAGIVMHDYNGISTYTYAASLPIARETNASALLLWQAIVNAKQLDMEYLDLFGIAPDDVPPNHPWYGFSAFKRKFGGTIIRRSRTYDIPLKPLYYAYRVAYRARKAI